MSHPSLFYQKIIAEIGSVHDGSFGNALKLIDLAKDCGATIVKFQTHLADAETLPNAPMPPYFKGEPRLEYFRRTAFSVSQWRDIAEYCKGQKISFLSSPFSHEAVDLLEKIGVESYKIPSGEVSNIPLLEHVAKTGKPVLLSSGMSNWEELDRAVNALASCPDLVIMQCSSAYPCPPQKIGLNVIAEIERRYNKSAGFSDHTLGLAAPIAAAALGAITIEKHLTFSKKMYGSDAANAMEPDQFKLLTDSVREIWTALEHPVNKADLSDYKDMKKIFEKSIVTARQVKQGHVLQLSDLAFKKPGDGIPASTYQNLIGRKMLRSLEANQKIQDGDFS